MLQSMIIVDLSHLLKASKAAIWSSIVKLGGIGELPVGENWVVVLADLPIAYRAGRQLAAPLLTFIENGAI